MSIGVGVCLRHAPRKSRSQQWCGPKELDSGAQSGEESFGQGEQRYDCHAPGAAHTAPATGEVVHATCNRCKELLMTVPKNRDAHFAKRKSTGVARGQTSRVAAFCSAQEHAAVGIRTFACAVCGVDH